jgi:hypothetical protein
MRAITKWSHQSGWDRLIPSAGRPDWRHCRERPRAVSMSLDRFADLTPSFEYATTAARDRLLAGHEPVRTVLTDEMDT